MSSPNPVISVVMAMYNAGRYLREAIESVLAQTFSDFEFIIIDDGSTDNSVAIARSYGDQRIRLFCKPHRGLVPSLNHGIRVSRGIYIARMDADDVSLPDRFRLQHAYLCAHPDVALVGSWYTNWRVDKESIVRPPRGDYRIKYALFDENIFCHGTIMIRTGVLQKTGAYRSILVEDYDLWLRISEISRVVIVPSVLYRYRVHAGQITQNAHVNLRPDWLRAARLARQRCLFGKDDLGYVSPAAAGDMALATTCTAFALHAVRNYNLNLALRLLGASLHRSRMHTLHASADPGIPLVLISWAPLLVHALLRRMHRRLTRMGRLRNSTYRVKAGIERAAVWLVAQIPSVCGHRSLHP